MSGRPYDEIGARILTDDEIEIAVAAWAIDHPDQYAGAVRTLAHARNAELRELKEAEAAGTTVKAMRHAKTEERRREAARREADDLEKARRALGAANRQRGRPKGTRTHTRQTIVSTFRHLRTNFGRRPTQQELADNLDPRIAKRALQEHLTDYELPWPIE